MDSKKASTLVRDAVLEDAEDVAKLITELGYPTIPEAMRERLAMILADPIYATFVADTGGGVVGVAGAALGRYYEKDGIYSRLVVLAVSASARGMGPGRSARRGRRSVVLQQGGAGSDRQQWTALR